MLKKVFYIFWFFMLVKWSFFWGEAQIGPNTQGGRCYNFNWDEDFEVTTNMYFNWLQDEFPCRFRGETFFGIYFLLLPLYLWLKFYGRKHWPERTLSPLFLGGEYLIWLGAYYGYLISVAVEHELPLSLSFFWYALVGSLHLSLPILIAAVLLGVARRVKLI